MSSGINVLSLFDGISSGMVALERAGIKVNKYYASEVDKYATIVSKKNYPSIVRLGDVTKWKEWSIDWSNIDLLLAGFPCQSWSIAGKQLGDKDPRGALMWTMLDILNHIKSVNPKVKFLFENVKMKKENLDYVNKAIGAEPVEINSALLSAQNRKRLYWQNIGSIEQPDDRGIYLKDILERFPQNPTYMSEKFISRFLGYGKNFTTESQPKAKNLSASEYVKNGKQGDYLIESVKAYGPSLRKNYAQWDRSGKGYSSQQDRAFYLNGKHGTVPSTRTSGKVRVLLCGDEYLVRKLTPIECERLQTLPDNYTQGVSDTQRYKAIGNGWTVDVIAHILKGLRND